MAFFVLEGYVNILHFPSSLKSLQHIPSQPSGSAGTGHFNCVLGLIFMDPCIVA